eukprot:gene9430-4060_t
MKASAELASARYGAKVVAPDPHIEGSNMWVPLAVLHLLLLTSYQTMKHAKPCSMGILASAAVGCQVLQVGALEDQWVNPKAEETADRSNKVITIGNKTYQPVFGTYPKNCKWREVNTAGSKESEYQFWDAASSTWIDERPEACAPTGVPAPGPPGWKFLNGTPRTEVKCSEAHCIFDNLYYNNGKWYAIVDGDNHVGTWRLSRNQEIITVHVISSQAFVDSIEWNLIPGDTIMFDFIFFTHPTAIGHWWEMLGPLYSTLKRAEGDFKRPCDQFLLLHLKRSHVLEWVRAMIAVTLGVTAEQDLPPLYFQEETDNAYSQISQNLEGLDKGKWYIFERVMLTKDLYTGGGRTFLSRGVAQEFRSLVYEQYGLPAPEIRAHIPHVITYQRKVTNRRILNEEEFIEMLGEFGEVNYSGMNWFLIMAVVQQHDIFPSHCSTGT